MRGGAPSAERNCCAFSRALTHAPSRCTRAQALNALNDSLMTELIAAMRAHDGDASVGSIVLTGEGKAFAAGADIKEMQPKTFADASNSAMLEFWEVRQCARTRQGAAATHEGARYCKFLQRVDAVAICSRAVTPARTPPGARPRAHVPRRVWPRFASRWWPQSMAWRWAVAAS